MPADTPTQTIGAAPSTNGAARGPYAATGGTLRGRDPHLRQLSLRKTVQIAWRNIRQRLGRSLLVTSGIILALAFLTYILCSEALMRSMLERGPAALLEALQKQGTLTAVTDADAQVQTRWLVGLALLVSFVGILNAMLLSVTERFKEIGTMKCLGAFDTLIVELFLLESTFQGVVGTLAGVLIGLALTVTEGMTLFGSAMWPLLPVGAFTRHVATCGLIGVALTVVAALYPAWRAARMQPVEAMRLEV